MAILSLREKLISLEKNYYLEDLAATTVIACEGCQSCDVENYKIKTNRNIAHGFGNFLQQNNVCRLVCYNNVEEKTSVNNVLRLIFIYFNQFIAIGSKFSQFYGR